LYAFIDRDGTMGGDYYVKTPQEYRPYAGTREAFATLRAAGITSIILTNQSCIARGLSGGYDFAREFRDIGADDWFICPHDAGDRCDCRKPMPGLVYQAQRKYGMRLQDCYMIGDRWSDMAAGGAAGTRLILVRTGRGEESLGCDRHLWARYQPDYVADDLLDAARWLARRHAEEQGPSRGGKE